MLATSTDVLDMGLIGTHPHCWWVNVIISQICNRILVWSLISAFKNSSTLCCTDRELLLQFRTDPFWGNLWNLYCHYVTGYVFLHVWKYYGCNGHSWDSWGLSLILLALKPSHIHISSVYLFYSISCLLHIINCCILAGVCTYYFQ